MALAAIFDVPAPAKLNLFLHIVGRRADGYHLLQSLFALIDWSDTLHVERRGDGRLQRHDLGPALPADDLCLRAARLLQAETGTTLGADISIEKRIPAGAGMGGGSSDAATTLLALNRLWALDLPRARLLALGLRLGADVPFFIGGQNAFVEGIGERLTPIRLASRRFAVVKPDESIATRAIFAHPRLGHSGEAAIIESFTAGEANGFLMIDAGAVSRGRNDLEAAARSVCAQVGDAAEILEKAFGNSRMTGSGSAVFADLGPHPGAKAGAAPHALPVLPGGWHGRICCSLAEHPLAGWLDGDSGSRD